MWAALGIAFVMVLCFLAFGLIYLADRFIAWCKWKRERRAYWKFDAIAEPVLQIDHLDWPFP